MGESVLSRVQPDEQVASRLREEFWRRVGVAAMPDRRREGWPHLRFRPYLPDVAALETAVLAEMTG